ncbi:hypothetical protein [Staphylococcus phage vB_SsapH-Golestan-100]|nr:hypothetical protein [Staphylococcus phage vB_SsapH-Golestan-100]
MVYAVLCLLVIGLTVIVIVDAKIQKELRARLSKVENLKDDKILKLLHYTSFLNRFIVGKELPGTNGVKLKGTDVDDLEFFNNQIDLAGRIAEGKEEPEKEISGIVIFKTEGFREHFDKEDLAPHVSLGELAQNAMKCISGEHKCLVVERNNHQIVVNGNQIVSIEVFYKS